MCRFDFWYIFGSIFKLCFSPNYKIFYKELFFRIGLSRKSNSFHRHSYFCRVFYIHYLSSSEQKVSVLGFGSNNIDFTFSTPIALLDFFGEVEPRLDYDSLAGAAESLTMSDVA